jgi:hypothetical protein
MIWQFYEPDIIINISMCVYDFVFLHFACNKTQLTAAMCDDHWATEVLDFRQLRHESVFIAVLFHENEKLIPHFDHELSRLLAMIDASRSHLSI